MVLHMIFLQHSKDSKRVTNSVFIENNIFAVCMKKAIACCSPGGGGAVLAHLLEEAIAHLLEEAIAHLLEEAIAYFLINATTDVSDVRTFC